MSPDLVNGLFCVVGAGFMLNNLRVLVKDKLSRGVSALSQTFFCSWNVWSLIFYYQVAQWWSFAGQALVAGLYLTYISFMFYYRWREKQWRDTGWRPSWELADSETRQRAQRVIGSL